MANKVQLSAYADCIGSNMDDLDTFLQSHTEGAIGGLHLLPFYPSSADRGFAPMTYDVVDPKLGSWDNLQRFTERYDLCMEFMINHISAHSTQFQDFLAKGRDSEYADMFIIWDDFWGPDGPSTKDIAAIRTRKPATPVLPVKLHNGEEVKVWCTFGPEQIDIAAWSKPGWKFIESSVRSLCERGARVIRLDAFGYATKKAGTPCFFQEPEAWELLQRVEDITLPYGVNLLCEVHEDYETNIKLAKRGYHVYDFALPLLVLHAFQFKTAVRLKNWLQICPRRQITTLDTHDGMGLDDIRGLAGLCSVNQLQHTVTERLGCSANMKYLYNTETGAYEPHAHQYNCTYFSACACRDHWYLLARAIQFFTPGVPMVYYVGLLAGKNDKQAVDEEGSGRSINRHTFSLEEAEEAVKKPVVQALLDLCRFRNSHPAFEGQMIVDPTTEDHVLTVRWIKDEHSATLVADMQEMSFCIHYTSVDDGSTKRVQFLPDQEYSSNPFTSQGGVPIVV